MKRVLAPSFRLPLIAYRCMLLLALLLICLLIAGTIYAFLRSPGSGPLFRIGGSGPASANQSRVGQVSAGGGDAASVFTGIGRLRIPLKAGSPASGNPGAATLILSIAFPYSPEDRPFSEELASKIGEFRSIAADYFASLPAEKLVNLDEAAAKTEILSRYNANLRLGKIDALYFSDLMIVE